jgi:hypothetical protein
MVPDYYSILGVDPGADRSQVEAALERCQPIWSSGTRNPKTRHTYQSYLDAIPAMRQALLGDHSTRAAYDAELAAARRERYDLAISELQRLVRLRAAKGGLTVSDRDLLRTEASRLGVPDDDFQRIIEQFPPKPETPVEPDVPDPPVDVIEPAVRQQIRLALDHLRKRDLYSVLDLARDAPAAEITARADAERKKWMQKAQVTAEKTAWLEAISYAQSHLVTPEARARYDRTLVLESEEALGGVVTFTLHGLRRLDPGSRSVLRQEAGRLGIAPERAELLIRRACRAAGILDEAAGTTATPAPPPRLLRCRSCSGITTAEDAGRRPGPVDCRHCGASLRWDCPNCRQGHFVDEPRCPCGFPLARREPVQRHFESAQQAFHARQYARSLGHLESVLSLAPRHPSAQKAAERIKIRLAEVERLRASCEAEMAARSFHAAGTLLEKWTRLADPEDPALRGAADAIGRARTEAAILVGRAGELARDDPRAARALYIKALGLVRDDPEAKAGLRACPPDAPSNLRAVLANGAVRLSWSAPPADGLGAVGYRVVRKRGEFPAHADDGVLVGDFPRVECEDPSAVPGEVVGYSVFAVRGGVVSPRGASVEPLVILADVSHLRAEARSGEVRLSWTPPAGVLGVKVVRKTGSPPLGPDDGQPIETLRDHATDRGVQDGGLYHYGVYSLFRGPGGSVIASRGVTTSVMPHAAAEEVGRLQLTREGERRLRLSWTGATRGRVAILRSPQPLPLPAGSTVAAAQVGSMGGQWLEASENNHAIDADPPASGVWYYTPLTSWGEMLTIGPTTVYSCVPEPADLRAARAGGSGKFHVRWRWGPDGVACVLLARQGAYPQGPEDPAALRTLVTEDEYSRLGYHVLSLPTESAGAWHLAVYGILAVGKQRVYSQGLEPTSRLALPGPHPEITVSYSVRPPRFPGRPWSLTFRTDPPGQPIPALALVGHDRTIPLSVEDGEILDQFPASRDGSTFRIRTKRNLGAYRLRVFLDPHMDPKSLQPIRLRHPEPGGTRV